MNEPEAWGIIEAMKWSKEADYSFLAKRFFHGLGIPKMNELRHFVNDRVNDLYEAADKWEKNNGRQLQIGSDDGYSDLRYHVVGLGKEEFEKALNDPEELEKRYLAHDYKESFAYVFHVPEPEKTPEELREIEMERIVEMAEKLLQQSEQMVKDLQNLLERIKKLKKKS
jgi:hypothetical protein